jgi:hypothetical protein
MDGNGQEDQSKECGRLGPTIQVDSSCKLVTIAGSGKTGNPFQLDPHLLFFPRICKPRCSLCATTRFSC